MLTSTSRAMDPYGCAVGAALPRVTLAQTATANLVLALQDAPERAVRDVDVIPESERRRVLYETYS